MEAFDATNLKRITADGLDILLELKLKNKDIVMKNAAMGICDSKI